MQAFAPRTAAAVGVAGSGSLEGSPPTPLLFLGLPAVELFSAPACGWTSLSSLSLSTLTETRELVRRWLDGWRKGGRGERVNKWRPAPVAVGGEVS